MSSAAVLQVRRHPPGQVYRHWLITLVVAGLLLLTGLYWWNWLSSAQQLRQETLEQAQRRATQVNSAASEVIAMLFLNIELTMLQLIDQYRQDPGPAFERKVAQLRQQLPAGAMLQVGVIGADGALEYSSLGLRDRIDLGDREHFKVHLDPAREPFFIGKPLRGRVSGQWSLPFSHPIRQDGQLRGVLVLSVSPDYLRQALARLALASDDLISIYRQDGELLARNRDPADRLEQPGGRQPPFVGQGLRRSGHFSAVAPSDGVERLFQWQRLSEYPVTVVLGLSQPTLLQPIERAIAQDRWQALLATLLLWSSAGCAILLLRRLQTHVQKRRSIEHLALHDPLTGLHNRHALLERLGQLVATRSRQQVRFGLLFLDLDGFKPINDRHGHATGDAVLQAIAGRLNGCVRQQDFAARLGGDEFVLVLQDIGSSNAVQAMAQRIRTSLSEPLMVDGRQIRVGASIGMACYPQDGETPEALLAAADQMMYEVKRGQQAASAL